MTNKQQRKKAREAVLQALYAIHLSSEEQEKVLSDINERYNFDALTKEFVDELFKKTINNREILDTKIETEKLATKEPNRLITCLLVSLIGPLKSFQYLSF